MIKIQVKKLPHGKDLPLPKYMSAHAAGMDLLAAVEGKTVLKSGKRKLIPTGIAVALPPGFEAQIRPRSGLALKKGISIVNSPGTIDADYRGEVGVIIINHGEEDFEINRGDRIAQMIIHAVTQADWEEVPELEDTHRNSGGFGHTGV